MSSPRRWAIALGQIAGPIGYTNLAHHRRASYPTPPLGRNRLCRGEYGRTRPVPIWPFRILQLHLQLGNNSITATNIACWISAQAQVLRKLSRSTEKDGGYTEGGRRKRRFSVAKSTSSVTTAAKELPQSFPCASMARLGHPAANQKRRTQGWRPFTIEHFGRRTLMLFGATGMSISMVILGSASCFLSFFALLPLLTTELIAAAAAASTYPPGKYLQEISYSGVAVLLAGLINDADGLVGLSCYFLETLGPWASVAQAFLVFK
ncbi:hypothetical protein BO79DRAFT_222824 [Aspergillus costaricaensis CBS 115574]|uniref:Uncharacterized protein n=1 Tax=Aspergillus costaricaensis CBS 115574 TaxID=1448317 RepID=A0ACD1HYJ2_9EURO|nr:hypothetical protein BO79DRAFT_222824 [Aspergillus costaricaensis CBS 115574]RAK83116.1 hypothetical protein BO79DRAFT_222824 [Aspergillus costaricaensis CBS 115574]